MTSKLKCPFCQQELREIYFNGVGVGYICPNPRCKKAEKLKGNAEFWQALIQSQKNLETAKQALKQIVCTDKDSKPLKGVVSCWLDMDDLNKCIEQIEHKEQI